MCVSRILAYFQYLALEEPMASSYSSKVEMCYESVNRDSD